MSDEAKWLDVYLKNYNGLSAEAKEIEPFLKQNYKGNSYIPWATMERLTYQQDPNATFKLIQTINGNLIHTDTITIFTQKGQEIIETTALSHFVRISLTFLGKTVIDDYPIQDQSYDAPKAIDQNLVNKAIKRGMAKVASRATGLGLKLYENGDLQFETDAKKKKPIVERTEEALKSMETVEVPKVVKEEPVEVEEVVNETTPVNTMATLIKQNDAQKVKNVLKNLNPSLLRTYGFELTPDDEEETLIDNLSKVTNPEKLLSALERLLK